MSHQDEHSDCYDAHGRLLCAPESAELAVRERLLEAISPVADWFDANGDEGDVPDIFDVVAEIAKTLAKERADNIRYRNVLCVLRDMQLTRPPGKALQDATYQFVVDALSRKPSSDKA